METNHMSISDTKNGFDYLKNDMVLKCLLVYFLN
jgi:hypothetical protein